MPTILSSGSFPFCVATKNEEGKKFEEWDGSTLYSANDGLNYYPSSSSSDYRTVYGEGSLYCIKLTRDQAKLEPTKLTLANSNNNYITIDTDQNEVFIGNASSSDQVYLNSDKLYIANSGYSGSYETDQVILSNGSNTLTLDIPDEDVSWQEIDVCVDGSPMKMKVLGTEPYPQ